MILILKIPACVGVPEITFVVLSKESPFGKFSTDTDAVEFVVIRL
jgi:hypothetical protein